MVGLVHADNGTGTIKFLYSYGGRILPRSTDGKLRYVGGHTRVLTVDRSVSFAELLVKLGELCGSSVSLRCQLPTEDLDTLVSVTSDEDLANLIEEYDRAAASSSSRYPPKIRAILSPPKSLKVVSPPPSTTSSVDHHALNSSYAVSKTPPYRCVWQTSSPPVGIPVGVQKGALKVPYFPCHVQGNPSSLYLVPYWNRRQ